MPNQYGSTRITPLVRQGASRLALGYPASRTAFQETLNVTEAAAGTLTLTGSGVELFRFTDSGAGTITLTGSSSESHVYTDVRSGSVTLSGTSTESESHSRSGSGTVTVASGGVAESNVQSGASDFTGHSTIEFVTAGSSTESESHSRSGSGTATLAGTSVQSQAHTGTGVGTLTLTGSAMESWSHVYTDSASGTITLNYVRGLAYPGAFYPGQVYPGQSIDSTPSRDSNTRSGSITFTLTGTGVESYQNGSSIVYTDHGAGTIALTSLVDENFGTLDTGAGTMTFTGSARDSWGFTLAPYGQPDLGSLVGALEDSLVLTPDPAGTLTADPAPVGSLVLTPR